MPKSKYHKWLNNDILFFVYLRQLIYLLYLYAQIEILTSTILSTAHY